MPSYINPKTEQVVVKQNKVEALEYFKLDNPDLELFDIKLHVVINETEEVTLPTDEVVIVNKKSKKH